MASSEGSTGAGGAAHSRGRGGRLETQFTARGLHSLLESSRVGSVAHFPWTAEQYTTQLEACVLSITQAWTWHLCFDHILSVTQTIQVQCGRGYTRLDHRGSGAEGHQEPPGRMASMLSLGAKGPFLFFPLKGLFASR